MGRDAKHKGHTVAARERIDKAREHYRTRAERREKQVWPFVGPRDGKRRAVR